MAQITKQHELATFAHVTIEPATTVSKTSGASEVSAYQNEYRHTYRENVETDALVQLRHNISQLEDLHGRLRFAMSELQTLLRRG